jgi:putative membrane protein
MGERLHPAAIAVYAVKTLREAAVPLLVVLGVSVFGGGFDGEALLRGAAFAVIGTLAAAVIGAVRWAATRYSLAGEQIRLRRGWLSVKEVEVPFSRVQALDVEQGPVQRLFGVRALHVQTGGGGAGGEIVLDALGPADVARVRDRAARRRPAALPEERPAVPERRLSRRSLLVAALTSGQIGVILPVLAALSQGLDDLVDDPVQGEQAAERLLPGGVVEWALAAGGLLALAWLLAAIGAVVAFAGFTAQRDEDVVRIRRGLLARREVTLPVARVRAVRIVEGLLRQPFGLATLRVEVIGYAKEAPAAQTLFPLLRRVEVEPFLAELLPELADRPDGLQPPPPRARRRYLLPPAAAGLAVGAVAAVVLGSPWPLAVALPALAYGELRWRAAGWRLAGGRLAMTWRALARTTVLAPARNRESHDLAQTPLQRRARLADVEIEFGKGTSARIRHLDVDVARGLWAAIR